MQAFAGSSRPRKYWNDLKKKLKEEGSKLSEKIGQLCGFLITSEVAGWTPARWSLQEVISPSEEYPPDTTRDRLHPSKVCIRDSETSSE